MATAGGVHAAFLVAAGVALAGALILCNLSASNIVVGKADDREMLEKGINYVRYNK